MAVVLQERASDSEEWRLVCSLPCHATMTSAPFAQHRMVDHNHYQPVYIHGSDGSRVVLR